MRNGTLQESFQALAGAMVLLEIRRTQPNALFRWEHLEGVSVDGTGTFVGTFFGAL